MNNGRGQDKWEEFSSKLDSAGIGERNDTKCKDEHADHREEPVFGRTIHSKCVLHFKKLKTQLDNIFIATN